MAEYATIAEILSYFNTQCPNQFEEADKLKWLSECDEIIYNRVIANRDGAKEVTPNFPYTNSDLETELLVEKPYTELYRYWLEKSVHYANKEISAFNNALQMYNTYFENYLAYYNTTHKVKDYRFKQFIII